MLYSLAGQYLLQTRSKKMAKAQSHTFYLTCAKLHSSNLRIEIPSSSPTFQPSSVGQASLPCLGSAVACFLSQLLIIQNVPANKQECGWHLAGDVLTQVAFRVVSEKIGTKEQKQRLLISISMPISLSVKQWYYSLSLQCPPYTAQTTNKKYNLPPLPSIHYHSLAISWLKWYFRHLLSPYFSGSAAPSALFRFKPRAPMVIWSVPLVGVNVIKHASEQALTNIHHINYINTW